MTHSPALGRNWLIATIEQGEKEYRTGAIGTRRLQLAAIGMQMYDID